MITIAQLKQLLINAGWPQSSLLFGMAQACYECGTITLDSENERVDTNLTGIEWAENPATGQTYSWQHNAIKGAPMPVEDNPNGFYARFISLQDWANDFHRIVHAQFGWNDVGRPIDAVTVEDYAHRLKMNRYYQGPESNYVAGLKRFLTEIASTA